MSLLDRILPAPSFVVRDPDAVTRQMVNQYESLTGRTLYPAQVDRLMLDIIAYRESLMREAIQDAAKLNLVRFSRAPMLDFLGENIGVARLLAASARTTVRFTVSAPPISATLLPQGTVVASGDVQFATLTAVTVGTTDTVLDVLCECSTAGIIGNGFAAGQINTLVSSVPGLNISAIANLVISDGGAQAEDDEHLRERIVIAPEQFSNAGSAGAYKFHALSAHPDVVDVAVVSAEMTIVSGALVSTNGIPPGVVNLHPLTKTGLPSTGIKQAVAAKCNAETVRPLTDYVQVFDPVAVDYAITASIFCYRNTDTATVLAQAIAAVTAIKDRMQARLGNDIVRTQLIQALHVPGVYSVTLTLPATDTVLAAEMWPHCTAVAVTVAGTVNG